MRLKEAMYQSRQRVPQLSIRTICPFSNKPLPFCDWVLKFTIHVTVSPKKEKQSYLLPCPLVQVLPRYVGVV